MRKFLVAISVALVGLCATAQQKGDMAAGINLGIAPCLESGTSVTNFGIGAKFQYNVTDPVRLEAALDYGFKDKNLDVLTFGVNAHYIFKASDKFNVYPLVGLGYARIGGIQKVEEEYYQKPHAFIEDYMYSSSLSKFFFNLGVGAEYAVTEKLSFGAEIKYQYINDFNRLPISIGVTYKF